MAQLSLRTLGPVIIERCFTQAEDSNGPSNKVFKYTRIEGRNKQMNPPHIYIKLL